MTKGEQQIINALAAARKGEHYGEYGSACIMTGQFDAGLCWKCKIKDLEAMVAGFSADYCPAGCIFGLNNKGKLHLVGDCRAPASQLCKANIRDRGAY